MNELEEYLDKVCRPLGGAKSLRRHVREELREHLLEAAEQHQAAGAEPAEAVREAIAEFGDPEMVRQGLQDVYGRPVMAMLIEKAMAWKEKTMKTGWKWSFVAHLLLAMVLAGEFLFLISACVFILPRMLHEYATWELTLPSFSQSVFAFLIGMLDTYLPLWLPIVLVGWAVFEWRCHSESKPVIRLAGGALASLGTMVVLFLASGAFLLAFILLLTTPEAGQLIHRKAARASGSFALLARAGERGDWSAAGESARTLRGHLRALNRTSLAMPVLIGMDAAEDLPETRKLLDDATELSDDLADGIRDGAAEAEVRTRLSRLKVSYERLLEKVPGWPRRGPLRPSPRPGARRG